MTTGMTLRKRFLNHPNQSPKKHPRNHTPKPVLSPELICHTRRTNRPKIHSTNTYPNELAILMPMMMSYFVTTKML